MPTKRQRLVRNPRADLDPAMRSWFEDKAPAPVETYFQTDGEQRALWAEHGPGIVAEWVETAPGTRPSAWWDFDAPRQPVGRYPGWYFDGKLPEPRLRVGGKGTPCFEVLAYAHHYVLGIPDHWVADWSLDYYNGRAKDVHGKLIETEYHEGDFIAERFDPDDPPRYESQAAFLKRHGLLFEGERLKADDFQPEALPQELWPAHE